MSPIRSSATARSQRHATRAARGTFRLQHLGEQAQRGRPVAAGADRLGHQQLSQQRIGKRGPELADQIDEPVDLGLRSVGLRHALAGAASASSGGSSASAASTSSSDIWS